MKRWIISCAAALAIGGTATIVTSTPGSAAAPVGRAVMVDGTGKSVGAVQFRVGSTGRVRVTVVVKVDPASPVFHGFHVHANGTGAGCVTSPFNGFTEVGGHWDDGTHIHGAHLGDLPSLVRQASGRIQTQFEIDRFVFDDLVGRALIVHAGPDNFANVPLGPAANQYTDNGTAFSGTGGTSSTGNAGARFACGVIAAAA